jgi:formylglycine-generating enzyme required for sulfatase activity
MAAACIAGLAALSLVAWRYFDPIPPAGYGDAREADVFSDCEGCPEMLPIPPGEIEMGGPNWLRHRLLDLVGLYFQPRRLVRIETAFAMGRTEVTFAQWDACVSEGGCNAYVPPDEGWGRGAQPVIHVSWEDAQAYARWLSDKTGHAYRLPSEAEWEYAAKAGANTYYAWGRRPSHDRANYGGPDCPPCTGVVQGRDIWPFTAPVASFPPNAFGLHDKNGNLYEWVEDCFDFTLAAGTFGAAAYESGDCENRSMRGGAWYSDPRRITSYYRAYNPSDWRDPVIGFRVARDM